MRMRIGILQYTGKQSSCITDGARRRAPSEKIGADRRRGRPLAGVRAAGL
ncbi:hypothetical protein BURMUCF2_2259 [Burkholderia multivorans CF2]|nr:hypothetical protein BURMUCF2_2259 [Burkholderia multivorans CF2]